MFYKTDEPHGLKHNPFKSLVVPRPIGWVSSVDATGVVNLAPYSFFNAVASDPPTVMFAANGTHVEGGHKDTLRNVENTKEFVCSIATWEIRDEMNLSSASVARSVDEFALAGLTPEPSKLVAPPRVAESPVHLECVYLQTVELPSTNADSQNMVVFGQVIGIHIDERIIKDGMIDTGAMKPIARLGYFEYARVDEVFSMKRPQV